MIESSGAISVGKHALNISPRFAEMGRWLEIIKFARSSFFL